MLSDLILFLEIINGMSDGTVHLSYLTALSGNRNALAFQILAVLSLMLAFQSLYARGGRLSSRLLLFSAIVLVCSMFLTSSRSGIATMLLLYLFALFMRVADWRFLSCSMIGGVLFSLLIFYFPDIYYFFAVCFL